MNAKKFIENQVDEIARTIGKEKAISALSGGVDSSACTVLAHRAIGSQKGFGFKVVEPIKELFKHEVRLVARELGLPEEIYNRMPFPGPALATRIIGEVTPERVALVRAATVIVEEETAPLKPFQAFAVLLADKGTGIAGGARTFGDIIIIRSVESRDAMTAEPSPIPFEILTRMAQRITKALPQVSRVAYELTSKPPATIEYI